MEVLSFCVSLPVLWFINISPSSRNNDDSLLRRGFQMLPLLLFRLILIKAFVLPMFNLRCLRHLSLERSDAECISYNCSDFEPSRPMIHARVNSSVKLTHQQRASSTDWIPILYEDEYILAIHKPHGISHHNRGASVTCTDTSSEEYDDEDEMVNDIGILNRLRLQLQLERTAPSGAASSLQEEEPTRLYSVHRLDRVTSGILLFAKQSHVAGILSKAFRQHRIVKYYVGLSNKTPKKKSQGYVIGIQERGRRKSWKLLPANKSNDATSSTSPRQPHAHYAKTRFFTAGLGQFLSLNSSTESNGLMDAFPFPRTLLLLRPYTGQTHQLRVAMKSVGIPILGDPIYNQKPSTGSPSWLRCYLHATVIHIPAEVVQQFHNDTTVKSDPSLEWNGSRRNTNTRNITIYCPPSFASAWQRGDTVSSIHEPLWQPILHRLMTQHCAVDCP